MDNLDLTPLVLFIYIWNFVSSSQSFRCINKCQGRSRSFHRWKVSYDWTRCCLNSSLWKGWCWCMYHSTNSWPCKIQSINMHLTHLYHRFLVSVIMVRYFQQCNHKKRTKAKWKEDGRDDGSCGWRYMCLMISTFFFTNLNHPTLPFRSVISTMILTGYFNRASFNCW